MKTLAYHSIGDRVAEVGAVLYCVTETAFRQQMEYLHKKGTVPCGDSPLFITFDDGDMTNYTKAFPILKEYGMKAYFFIIGEWVGKPGYMNWDQIRELKDAGMTIGSHGMTHRILPTLKDDELDYEFTVSKKLLEDKLHIMIDVISIPRGFSDERVMEKARAAGYKTIFTSNERIVVKADWDMSRFTDALSGRKSTLEMAWEFVKNSSVKLLGVRNYDRLRARILR